MRKKTRSVNVGNVVIGGGAPVLVQSMTNTKTADFTKTLNQIEDLASWGCELIRLAVPDQESLSSLARLVAASPLAVVADIHFDYKLALGSIASGVHGLRINPGNIGGFSKTREIIQAAKEKGVAIRIGVNSGSLARDKVKEFGGANAQAMVASALEYVDFFEKEGFEKLVLSLKSTDLLETIEANRIISELTDYPLHIGLTEAGTMRRGLIGSAAALSPLLLAGIGDTIRISLTDDPALEVVAAWDLLSALKIRQRGLQIISCPTCGRCEIDLKALVEEIEEATKGLNKPLTIAIMGCPVNGPGEAKEADLGIAGGKDYGVLFVRGKIVANYPYDKLAQALLKAIEDYT